MQSLPRRWWNRLGTLARSRFETAIVQRRLLTSVELQLLRRRTANLVFDFDDAVWLRDSFTTKGLQSARRLRRFARVVRSADAIVAGNEFLALQAARFAPPDRVHIIPTCVEPKSYPMADHSRREAQLVWIG